MKGVNLYLSIEKIKAHGAGRAGAALVNYEPDILAEGLKVVFCGVNPAATAAIAGHNFSNGSNRFWTALHLAGFTDRRLQPREERQLLDYGCGITAVVDRPTRRADEITPAEFVAARPGFEAEIRRYAPRFIAFLGKRAVSAMLGQPQLPWGQLPDEFAGTTVWILPNPSGLNRSFTLCALVTAYAELHRALGASEEMRTPTISRR
jgi:double-stranded uracil-DNA glycosylase